MDLYGPSDRSLKHNLKRTYLKKIKNYIPKVTIRTWCGYHVLIVTLGI